MVSRRTVAPLWLACLALVAAMLGVAPAAHALAAPGGLSVAPGSNPPDLSWQPVSAATSYQVQIDDDPGFGSPTTTSTVNTRWVPTAWLAGGDHHWRVRAVSRSTYSGWSLGGEFTTSPVDVPRPLAPVDGDSLAQPQEPPLLRWTTSPGATTYIVEVDAEGDFVGTRSWTTKSTSLVVPVPLTEGTWHWRVTASKPGNLLSKPSSAWTFEVEPLARPLVTSPADDVNTAVRDVVLDWTAVPGAKTYDVQVAKDDSFQTLVVDAPNVYGTRYSPPTTLYNDQFWWRVRAVDLAGVATPWTKTQYGFKRTWLDQPKPVYPTGSPADPPTYVQDGPYYEWTPVPHASHYELITSSDPNMSNPDTCWVAGTTYTPRDHADCGWSASGETMYWQVRPMDLPYKANSTDWPGGLPGIRSQTQAFRWDAPALQPFPGTFSPVTGLKISLTGSGADDPTRGCTDDACSAVPATPVLSWDAQPGITKYIVHYGNDENFTTTPLNFALGRTPETSNTKLALRIHRQEKPWALPESNAGESYHWYVQPCAGSICGPSPVSQNPPLPGAKSFTKTSPAVSGLTSEYGPDSENDRTGTEVVFRWDDYLSTNSAHPLWRGEQAYQSAKRYRIEVASDPGFDKLLDTKEVDQTTYTAFDRLYPGGELHWRVQALDVADNRMPEASGRLTKSTAELIATAPRGGADVPGTTPFEWSSSAYARSYDLEVYENSDTSFSPGNRVVLKSAVQTAAFVPPEPLAAGRGGYVWRVRRNDSYGNPGPWSAPAKFTSTGQAPELLSNGAWQPASRVYLRWSSVPGAATYKLVLIGGWGYTISTVATSHAVPKTLASSQYTWTVTALDAAGEPLGTSPAGAFGIDSTPPRVTRRSPGTLGYPKSNFVATFSEPVRNVGGRTFYLTKRGSTKRISARVSVNSTATKAILNPSTNLRRGTTYTATLTTAITDRRANRLARTSWNVYIR